VAADFALAMTKTNRPKSTKAGLNFDWSGREDLNLRTPRPEKGLGCRAECLYGCKREWQPSTGRIVGSHVIKDAIHKVACETVQVASTVAP
jgi:hypothetical protein